MSFKSIGDRQFSSKNNENPIKNIKNIVIINRKQTVLKVLTNTVHSIKKSASKCAKSYDNLKVLPMKNFETEIKCKSPTQNIMYTENDHFNCIPLEKNFLPPSMTCNIDMLSNFFSIKNDNNSDWFLEDYNNNMINKIKRTFEDFGEPDIEHSLELPPMPIMDFPKLIF